jgi:hypothetical protein
MTKFPCHSLLPIVLEGANPQRDRSFAVTSGAISHIHLAIRHSYQLLAVA